MTKHHHNSDVQNNYWQERTAAQDFTPPADELARPLHSQAFKHPHTSLGVAGHIVHMLGVFVPVLAGEFIESPQKYKKVVRLASIGTALAYDTLYVVKEAKRREKQETKLEECRNRD